MGGPPPGARLLNDVTNSRWSLSTYRTLVLILTFIAYACYHASRKPTSIVKSVLDPQPLLDGGSQSFHTRDDQFVPWPAGPIFVRRKGLVGNFTSAADKSAGSRGLQTDGWAPFNGEDGTAKLGEIDLAFLLFYSTGMYVAGHLGDTLDLRLFLAIGMVGSGVFVGLFGMGYFWNVHSFLYYILMQMAAGLFQATGWPSVVAVVGNWFGKRKRGLIMGVWNAHTSVGNITGSLLAACVLQYGWGWSFILPGALIFCGGIIVYLFLAAYPEDVGLACPHLCNSENEREIYAKDLEGQMHAPAVKKGKADPEAKEKKASASRSSAVGILEACFIPGVIPFAMCLFFSKLVAYTFLYWLPFYLSQTAIGGEYMSVKSAGNLSALFDVGGIMGGILAGHISDRLRARAITAASFMYLAIPSLLLYRAYGDVSRFLNIVLMMIAGLFVNGPYALITTAVSADLGTHSSLKGNSRALATVTAIIDGTGSVGAAFGPLLTGFLSRKGWNAVFSMLSFGALVAGLLLSRLVMTEITEIYGKSGHDENLNQQGNQGSASEPLLREQR
ncbi:putative glycerol-3-phosphate transporter 4 [Nymphaea colorata]|nr:putative glycerol-3-phosphate transporter 4 [Nymphaea colorata]